MNLKRCKNGHYYDSDKYAACPRCSGHSGQAPVQAAPAPAAVCRNPEGPQPKKWLAGWLVCIEGVLEGRVYELKGGKNTIGGPGQDIDLGADSQVARSCQMVIHYDGAGRIFTADAGDSRELSYVNGQVVLCSLKLKDRDILQIGEEKLLFIPLCGEGFAWSEGEDKGE